MNASYTPTGPISLDDGSMEVRETYLLLFHCLGVLLLLCPLIYSVGHIMSKAYLRFCRQHSTDNIRLGDLGRDNSSRLVEEGGGGGEVEVVDDKSSGVLAETSPGLHKTTSATLQFI